MSQRISIIILALLISLPLQAGFVHEFTPDLTLKMGADLRTRYEYFDRELFFPDGSPEEGRAVDYLRFRTRLWFSLDLAKRISLNARLVNRSQHFFSNSGSPNNADKNTWQAPDEVIFDLLNISLRPIADERLTLTIGRQELSLGNQTVMAQGTPFDQARTSWHDGIRLNIKEDRDVLDLFLFYDTWKDRFLVINDRNRRLRAGDIFTAGTAWTHRFGPALNLDLYYLYHDVDDDYPDSRERVERGHPVDANNSLHTLGGRLFGRPCHTLEYSAELAGQGGRSAAGGANRGFLTDLRLKLHAPENTPLSPTLGLQYVLLSGDRPGSSRNEGWNPLMAELPQWRGDLLSHLFNNVWTNLHFVNAELGLRLRPELGVYVAAGALWADERGAQSVAGGRSATGNGNFIGTVGGAGLEYKINRQLSFCADLLWLQPGDYYATGHDSCWGRLQFLIQY